MKIIQEGYLVAEIPTSVLCFNETLQTSNAKASVKQQPIQMYLLVKAKGISSGTEPLEPTTFQKLQLKSL